MTNLPSKSQSLVERLRTEATETNIEGFELSPCWTPELLTEAADEIERLREALLFIGKAFELEDDQTDSGITYREALAPKPMMSADGGEDIPL